MKKRKDNNCIVRVRNLGLIFAFLTVAFFATGVADAQKETPRPAPFIVIQPDVYYPQDEILYIEGKGAAKSIIELRLQKQGAKPFTFTIKADSNGDWALAERVPLEEGEWEARARTQAEDGSVSEWSSPRIFRTVKTGITLGGITIKFAFLSLVIVLLCVIGAALIIYFVMRVRKLRYLLMTKEVREAKEAVRENLSLLRTELLEELRLMALPGKALSAEELSRKERVFRELDQIERRMEKEIDDIQEKT